MSRCFPFPPPGYERKARPDDGANLFLKHKEKKHKKDKKDKEKKERKERKDKERSSEKHREKKNWKHKDRDKKDKNKDKEEKKGLEEKKIVGPSYHQNGEKIGPIGTQVNQIQDGRFLLELEKRVRNDNGAREIQNVGKICITGCSSKSTGKVLESNIGTLVEGHQKFRDKGEDSRMPNGHRLNSDSVHMENGSLCHILENEQKNVGEGQMRAEKTSEKGKERKDKSKHKNNDGREDRHKVGAREKKSRSKDKKRKKEKAKEEEMKEVFTLVQSKLIGSGNNTVDLPNDRGPNLSKESNAKNGNLGKRNEPLTKGCLHGNEIPLNKFPRPLSSAEVIQNGSIIDTSNGAVQSAPERAAAVQIHKLNDKFSSSNLVVENGSKLEKSEAANYFALKRQEATSNCHKAMDSLPFSQPTLAIGRKPEPCQIAVNFASVDHGVLSDHTVNKKVLPAHPVAENGIISQSSQSSCLTSAERLGKVCKIKLEDRPSMVNGSVGLKKLNSKSLQHSPAPGQLKEAVGTRVKPQHPDSKYLSEILSVPKLDWSDVYEQEWLFTCEDHQSKKPKIDSTTGEEPKQVWAEALRIESADVTALPYVIPY